MNQHELVGEWRVTTLRGTPVDGARAPTLRVDADGAVSGSSTVNRYTGRITPDGPLVFGPLASTRRAGPPEAMELESAYFAALGAASGATVETRLRLTDDHGAILLEFEPIDAA